MVGWKRKRIDSKLIWGGGMCGWKTDLRAIDDDNNTSRRMEEAQIASSLMSVR